MELKLAAEYPPADEQRHIDCLVRQLRGKMEREYVKTRTVRDAHPKIHGCVRGEFSIAPNLPAELSVGAVRARPHISGMAALFKPERQTVSLRSSGRTRLRPVQVGYM